MKIPFTVYFMLKGKNRRFFVRYDLVKKFNEALSNISLFVIFRSMRSHEDLILVSIFACGQKSFFKSNEESQKELVFTISFISLLRIVR